ncbi:hypothetical protein [Massilia sp. TS11]|uniref:hypothetical protein n=1 Tax=Massilia sp. TS11 TaxID=2908003 RepID=UPI001EDAF63A|nr:hypothetical protein [Massilia sp. TS11]MCG2586492.1 hypothetical protein [Massilia sp. TS11]
MTTKLNIERIWEGETVAILGNAPTLPAELEAMGRPARAIAANQAAIVAPWADMLVSIDANWRPELNDFAGVRVIGFESDAIDAAFAHFPHESVEVAPGHTIEIRNNTCAAMRLAASLGAAKIVLLGLDLEYYEANMAAPGSAKAITNLAAELTAQGVPVERFTMPAASAPAEQPKKQKGRGV